MAAETPCACDACETTLRLGDAQADGYCAFCASGCFPATDVDGKLTRTRMSAQSRASLHARAAEPPIDDERLRRELTQRATRAVVEVARPLVEPKLREAAAKFSAFLGRVQGGSK